MSQQLPIVDHLFEASAVFCVLPWVHICGSVDGVWGRCCVDSAMYHPNLADVASGGGELNPDALGCTVDSPHATRNPRRVRTLLGAFDTPQMRATRRALLRDEPVSACRYCYEREASGGRSYRQSINELFRARIDWSEALTATASDGAYPGVPCYLDIRWGNLCNLRCVMCEFPVSSRWYPGTEQTPLPPVIEAYRAPELWYELRQIAPTLQRVYFAGGEPMLHTGHRRLLRLLVELERACAVEIFYNTNLTVVPDDVVALWPHFRTVGVGASCDGIGATFEHIRVGAGWPDFVRNLARVRSVPRTHVWLAVTPQRANAANLIELVDWALEAEYGVDLTNLLHHPPELSLVTLPAETRACLIRDYQAAQHRWRSAGHEHAAGQIEWVVRFLSRAAQSARACPPEAVETSP